MPRQSSQPYAPVNTGFNNPFAGLNAVLGDSAVSNAGQVAQAYGNTYNNSAGFGAKHPIVTGLLGTLFGGPATGLGLVAAGQQNKLARQQATLASYDAWAKSVLANQESLDKITQPRNQVANTQSIVSQMKRLGQIPQEAPDLYNDGSNSLPSFNQTQGEAGAYDPSLDLTSPAPREAVPNLSREYVDNYLKGITGGSKVDYYRNLAIPTQTESYRAPSGISLSTAVSGLGGGTQTLPGGTGQLQAGVQSGGYQAPQVQAPLYVDDPNSIITALTSLNNTGLTQGTERYKFDQEAPKRLSEILATNALTDNRKADTNLKGIEAKYRPQLLKSQITRNNRPPAGSAGRAPSRYELLGGLLKSGKISQAQYQNALLSSPLSIFGITPTTGAPATPADEAAANGF